MYLEFHLYFLQGTLSTVSLKVDIEKFMTEKNKNKKNKIKNQETLQT